MKKDYGQEKVSGAFNPCMGLHSSLRDGILQVAVIEMIFTFAYIIHGAYLFSTGLYAYGTPSIITGLICFILCPLLWKSVKQPTKPGPGYFQLCIFLLIFAQLIIIASTVARNFITKKFIVGVNIWMLCAFFVQCYIIWLVYIFSYHNGDEENVTAKPDQTGNGSSSPPQSPPLMPENENNGNGDEEDDTVIIESSENRITPNRNSGASDAIIGVAEALTVNSESNNQIRLDKQGTSV